MADQPERTEAIGAAAGAGFRLSLVLNAVKMKMQNADAEIQNISRAISDFSLMLKQVARTMEAGVAHPTPLAIDTVFDIKDHSERIFEEIKGMTELAQVRDEKGNLTEIGIGQKVVWCFKQSKVPYLLGQLDYLKLNLVIMLQVLQLAEVYSPSKPRPSDKFMMQERAEIQNMIVLQHWSQESLKTLLSHVTERDRRDSLTSNASEDPPPKYEDPPAEEVRLAINAPPKPAKEDEDTSKALVKYQEQPVQQLDDSLHQALSREYQVLNAQVPDIVNHLLREWTIPDYSSQSGPRGITNGSRSGRYRPTISDDDSDTTDTDDSSSPQPRGYYLENGAPLKPAIKKKLRFANQQAHVESDSDEDDHRRERRTTRGKHILRSDEDSSDSDLSPPPSRNRKSDRAPRPYFSGPSGPRHSPPEKEAVRIPPPQARGGIPPSPRQGPVSMYGLPLGSNQANLRPPPLHNQSHPGTYRRPSQNTGYASPNASPTMTQGDFFPQQRQPPPGTLSPTVGGPREWPPQQQPRRPKGNHSQHSSYEGRSSHEGGKRGDGYVGGGGYGGGGNGGYAGGTHNNHGSGNSSYTSSMPHSHGSSSSRKKDKRSDASRNIKKGIGIGAAAAGLMELLSGLDGI